MSSTCHYYIRYYGRRKDESNLEGVFKEIMGYNLHLILERLCFRQQFFLILDGGHALWKVTTTVLGVVGVSPVLRMGAWSATQGKQDPPLKTEKVIWDLLDSSWYKGLSEYCAVYWEEVEFPNRKHRFDLICQSTCTLAYGTGWALPWEWQLWSPKSRCLQEIKSTWGSSPGVGVGVGADEQEGLTWKAEFQAVN